MDNIIKSLGNRYFRLIQEPGARNQDMDNYRLPSSLTFEV